MIPQTVQEPRLTDEAKAVIWRIFDDGASPQTQLSPYQLIEPVLMKHLSPTIAGPTIAAVRAWFETHGDRQWLKSDVSEAFATLVLESIGAAPPRPHRAPPHRASTIRRCGFGWSLLGTIRLMRRSSVAKHPDRARASDRR